MNWVNDPHTDLTAIPVLEGQDKAEEEIHDPESEFWEEAYKPGFYADYHQAIIVPKRICIFDDNGDHIKMADNCPHFDMYDEMGMRMRPGWTAQS